MCPSSGRSEGDELQRRIPLDRRLILDLGGKEDVGVARLHHRQTRGLLLDRPEDDLVEERPVGNEVVRVLGQGDVIARHPLRPHEGTRAVRGGVDRVLGRLLGVDLDRRQVSRHRRPGTVEVEADDEWVEHLDRVDLAQERRVRRLRLRIEDVVDRPLHVLGREILPAMELDTLVEHHVELGRLGEGPLFGQPALDRKCWIGGVEIGQGVVDAGHRLSHLGELRDQRIEEVGVVDDDRA